MWGSWSFQSLSHGGSHNFVFEDKIQNQVSPILEPRVSY